MLVPFKAAKFISLNSFMTKWADSVLLPVYGSSLVPSPLIIYWLVINIIMVRMCMYRPVLVSSQQRHIQKAVSESSGKPSSCQCLDSTDERVLQTMKWGLVPSWHKGDPKKTPTLLNNCRLEGMLEKPSFRTAVQRRQRCVVLADG